MTADQVPEPEQRVIDPLKCMGDLAEGLFSALTYARAGFIQIRQRYTELQQQHETLGEAFDARGVEIERLRAQIAEQVESIEQLSQSVRDANEREARRYQEPDQSARITSFPGYDITPCDAAEA